MEWIVTKDYKSMSDTAADMIVEEIKKNQHLCIALPTGGTPIGTLENLAAVYNERNLDYSKLRCFNIDEYVSLGKDHEQGYYYFLNNHLYSKTNIDLSKTYVPDVFAKDLEFEAELYEGMIQENGYFDLILLGIGEDGHIGFNEPSIVHEAICHVADLDNSTIDANARFFENKTEVPKQAITLGIGTILKAKKIILIANGKKKSDVIKKLAITNEIDPKFPASFLLTHPDVTIICDKEAVSCKE